MKDWYYADVAQQQHGPVTTNELRQLFLERKLNRESLVWQEGMSQWQPLGDFEDQLSIQAADSGIDLRTDYASLTRPPTATDHTVGHSPYSAPTAALDGRSMVYADGKVVYAGFWKRYAASALDGMLMFIVFAVVAALAFAVIGINSNALMNDIARGTLGIAMIAVMYGVPLVLQAIYFTWMQASGSQATLGKLAVGIKVTDNEGRRINNGRSLGRWAGYFFFHLFSCGMATLVSAFMVGLSSRKQALHDMAAGTLVVDRWAFTAHPERQRHELGVVTIIIIVISILAIIGYMGLAVMAGIMGARH